MIPTFEQARQTAIALLLGAAASTSLVACGGGGGSTSTVDVTPAAVEGVATPNSISVVTANNAD